MLGKPLAMRVRSILYVGPLEQWYGIDFQSAEQEKKNYTHLAV